MFYVFMTYILSITPCFFFAESSKLVLDGLFLQENTKLKPTSLCFKSWELTTLK